MSLCKTKLICVHKSSIRDSVLIWGGGIFPQNNETGLTAFARQFAGGSDDDVDDENILSKNVPTPESGWGFCNTNLGVL